jgi:hypothetical protein
MKKIIIGNTIYLPIAETNKYVQGNIDGTIFFYSIYTLDEIKEKHKNSFYELIECDALRDFFTNHTKVITISKPNSNNT